MEECEWLAVVTRKIWFRRNTKVHGGSLLVQTNWSEGGRMSKIQDSAPIVWKIPPSSIIKVNWDVAVDKQNKCIHIGIIVRDHKGSVLAAISSTKLVLLDLVTTEAFATLYAAEFRCDLALQKIILEGDVISIVKSSEVKDINWSIIG